MILVIIVIVLFYLLLIGSLIYGFDKIETFKLEDIPAKTKFSILIPFRNEADNLPELLQSITQLNYPKSLFEIIFIDDDSSDDSKTLIETYFNTQKDKPETRVISNTRTTNAPKKDAITSAIGMAKQDWMITTDADCILPKYWLDSFDEYIKKNKSVCIAAPVAYKKENTFLNRFQILDFLSLQGATIGGFGINKPFLCNGANLAYKKNTFIEINGFEGNTNIPGGDDIFILEKITKKHPKQTHYLKCYKAIVQTKAQSTLKNIISQRIRWASKTSAYNNWFGKLTGLIVLLMNVLVFAGLALLILNLIPFKTWFYMLFIKFNIDFLLIYKSASFFKLKATLKSYLFAFILYPFFSVYVAFASLFSSYTWKGRSFKK